MRRDRQRADMGSAETSWTEIRGKRRVRAEARPGRGPSLTGRLLRARRLRPERLRSRSARESRRDQPELVTRRVSDAGRRVALRLCRAELGRGAERPRGDDPRAPYDRRRPGVLQRRVQPHPPASAARRSRGRPEPGRRAQAPVDDARLVVGLRHRHQVRPVRPGLRQGRRSAREDDPAECRADVRSPDRHERAEGVHGPRDGGGARADLEQAQGHPHHRDGWRRTIALRRLARRLASHQGPRRAGRRVHGREGHAARNRDGRLPRRDRNRRLSHHDAHRGNEIYDPAKKQVTQSFPDYSPEFIMAPTLADEYGVSAGHKPVVIGTSFQDRAAMGMVGHGAAHHPGNKNHIVVLYAQPKKPAWKEQFPGGDQEHRLMTNIDLYTFPAYLARAEPDALRQGADRRQWHVDGAQDRRQLQRPLHARLRRVRVRQHADDDGPRAHRSRRRDRTRLHEHEADGLRRAPLGTREPRGPRGAPGARRLRRQAHPEAQCPGR